MAEGTPQTQRQFSAGNYEDSVRRLMDRLVERNTVGASKAKDFAETVGRLSPIEFVDRAQQSGIPAIPLAEELATGFGWKVFDPAVHLPADRDESWILTHSGTLLVVNPFDKTTLSRLTDRFHSLIKNGYGVMPYTARIAPESASWGIIADPAKAREYVVSLIADAAKAGASDIHLRPEGNEIQVRFVIDSSARPVATIKPEHYKDIAGTLMSMAGKNPGEHIRPVGGRIVIEDKPRRIELRMECCEVVVSGEKSPHFTLRILSSRLAQRDIIALGFTGDQSDLLKQCVRAPQGIIVVSGPTGAGKSTSLGAALCWLKDLDPGKTIYAIEDPVETEYTGIDQIQVNEKSGMTFSKILRSLLRKAPNAILVGEIRDPETMIAAVEASQTGHLILTTLHANSAASVFDRASLIGDEVRPILNQFSTVSLAYTGQRLVRKVCPSCSAEMSWEEALRPNNKAVREFRSELLEEVYKTAEQRYATHRFAPPAGSKVRISNPKGCDKCNGGYKGRVLITEVLKLSSPVRAMMRRGAPAGEIEAAAIDEGFRPLWAHALECVGKGLVTLEEAELKLEAGDDQLRQEQRPSATVLPLPSSLAKAHA